MAKLPPFVQKVTLKGGLRYRGYAQDPTTGKRRSPCLASAVPKVWRSAWGCSFRSFRRRRQ